MAHDLSIPAVVEVIDVRRYQRAEIQCRLAGAASTAVVEVKRSMSPFAGGMAVSLPTTTTLTLNGSVSTRIDTTNIAYLHIEVTTEDSGKAFELEYQRTRPMVGDVIERTLRADDPISAGGFGAGSNIKGFILAQGDDSASKAVFEVKRAIGIGYPLLSLSPAVTVVLDGSTITEVDMSGGGFFEFDCTTTQADYTTHLMVYVREEVAEDTASGGGADDKGLMPIFAEEGGNLATGTSSGFQFSFGNGDVADGFGIVVPVAGTIVGVSLSVRSNGGATCTVEVYKGADADSTSSATVCTVSLSASEQHNYTDYSGSPVTVNAGDWITFKTTALSGGTINGGRVAAWIKPD